MSISVKLYLMKKLFRLLLIVSIILTYIYSNFYYFDPSYGCRIAIVPTFLPSNYNTKEILKILKKGSPDDYARVCKYVSVINKNPSCGGFDGGCFQPSKPRTIYIGNDQGNIALASALIVHETCHAIQGSQKKQLIESECYSQGNAFLEIVTQY